MLFPSSVQRLAVLQKTDRSPQCDPGVELGTPTSGPRPGQWEELVLRSGGDILCLAGWWGGTSLPWFSLRLLRPVPEESSSPRPGAAWVSEAGLVTGSRLAQVEVGRCFLGRVPGWCRVCPAGWSEPLFP